MRSGSFTPARQALWFLVAVTSFATPSAQAGTSDLDAALEAWRAEHGTSWLLDVDEKTGVGTLLYSGAAEPAFLPENDAGFVSVAIGFVAETEALHGIDADLLVFERLAFLPLSLIDSSDKTTVKFMQEVSGVRVEGGYVNVLMDSEHGYLLSIQSTGLPGLEEVDTHSTITAEEARSLAGEQLEFDTGTPADTVGTPELVIAQIEDETSRTPLLTWRVRASAGLGESEVQLEPVSFYYHIDAATGDVVRSTDAISHFHDITGTVSSWVTVGTEALTASSGVELKPMSRMLIYDSNTFTNSIGSTNPDGTYAIPHTYDTATIYFRYEGDAVSQVQHNGGTEHTESLQVFDGSGNDLEMNSAGTEAVTAQANAYYWLTYLHDWILETNPTDTVWDSFPGSDHRVDVVVYRTGYACNGDNDWYTGEAGFTGSTTCEGGTTGCNTGWTCSNKANATLVIHETAHMLSVYYYADLLDDGSLDEAISDIFAMYATDQPIVGKHWCYDGGQTYDLCVTRSGDNVRRACHGGDCYDGGGRNWADCLSGAFWKMRVRLKNTLGATNGAIAADLLLNAWMNAYVETSISADIRTHLLTLDDVPSGAGFSNGTPHWADIDLGFADQGFPRHSTMASGIVFSSASDPGQTTNETGPYTVSVAIVPNFASPITAAKIHYQVNGDGFDQHQPVSMTKAPFTNLWSGSIPGQAAPAVIEYYFTATDSTGSPGQTAEYPVSIKVALDATPDQYDDPPDTRYELGEATPIYRRFFVGAKDQIFFDDFESPPHTGWTHGGNLDDWEFGDPTGEPDPPIKWSDPEDAYSGTACVGNDLGTDDAAYEENADNWLRTPEIELPNSAADGRTFIRFRRWLSCGHWNDPYDGDIAQIHVLSADPTVDEVVWRNHLFVYHVDGEWALVEVEITDVLDGLDTVQIEWSLETNEDEADEFGGWSIDDVEVFTIYNP